jgi:hypothetical protein
MSEPEYFTSLIRHFEDLRNGTHCGSTSRRDKEGERHNREQKNAKPPNVGPLLPASVGRDAGKRNRPRFPQLRETATTTAQHMLFPARIRPRPCSFCQESPCSSNASLCSAYRFLRRAA